MKVFYPTTLVIVLILSSLFSLTSTATTTKTKVCDVEGKVYIPGIRRPEQVKILLNGGEHTAYTLRNGEFKFSSIESGVYFLEVDSKNYAFSPLKIDVCTKGQTIRAKTADETFKTVRHPLKLTPYSPKVYYEKGQPLNPLKIFKSPMGIMIAVSLFSMFILPKLSGSIDPEELKQMQQENGGGGLLGKLLGGVANPQQSNSGR
ncbi:er membrane protein complex subunit 7 [Anaeramoeba flamelloides]|uniref:Er membrane protein complex subunit n=1 Tax=Anaeramoeba flamelloides TaxID=1746091 RepID=A0AAV7ZAL7_9EUKA|nr:er membrane protein complex subunit [Anaeramoeba flamelloides]KAJ6244186.1 er membrane protein complex subunit 7 [Anaeramoeba flamelloides]